MGRKRYITIQIIPDDSSQSWAFRVRYRFFEFLFYATIIALFAVAFGALKVTEINGKVLLAEHLSQKNRELQDKQQKMMDLEKELRAINEKEKILRNILQTFLSKNAVNEDENQLVALSEQEIHSFVEKAKDIQFHKVKNSKEHFVLSVPDIWPVIGIVSQEFNSGSSNGHTGIDVVSRQNAVVNSTAEGLVTYSGWTKDLGLNLKVDHGNGYETVYAHLSRIFVKIGDHIHKGSNLGIVGNTGYSYGPHLHYEIWLNGKVINPRNLLK